MRTAWGFTPREGVGFNLTVDGGEGDLALAFQGKLRESIEADLKRLEVAYWTAMDRVVQAGKGRLRADIVAGGFHKAQALSKTWRGNTYPKSKNSLEVAGWLSTKFEQLIDVFQNGAVIQASDGKYLAIPLGPAKAILRRLNQARNRSRNAWGKFVREDNPVERVAAALGVDLVPRIDRDTGRGVLIADTGLRLTPTGRSAKRQEGGGTPIFALSRQATLQPRIKGMALVNEIERAFPSDFIKALAAELPPETRSA